jgi:hypothetical protein
MAARLPTIMRSGTATLVFLACLPLFATPAQVAVDCTTLTQWFRQSSRLQVNQVHIFCGEWKNGTPRGFHSRPGGLDPATIDRFTITQQVNAQGIYGGTWSYRGHAQPRKFSTMFPDTCLRPQVIHSIAYAASHRTPCPANAPDWAICGPNRPHPVPPDPRPFCDASDGTIFTVAMALRGNGNVQTAFPLR